MAMEIPGGPSPRFNLPRQNELMGLMLDGRKTANWPELPGRSMTDLGPCRTNRPQGRLNLKKGNSARRGGKTDSDRDINQLIDIQIHGPGHVHKRIGKFIFLFLKAGHLLRKKACGSGNLFHGHVQP